MVVRKTKPEPFWIGAYKDWKFRLSMKSNALVAVSARDKATHVILLGSTGSGKSTAMVHFIAQAIGEQVSFIIICLRGDLASAAFQLACLRIPESKIALLDLREKVPLTGFNPLAGSGEAYFRVLNLLDAIAEEHDLGVQTIEYMRFAFLLLAEAQQPITKLEHVFFDEAFRADLLARSTEEPVQEFWSRYDQLSKEKQQAIASPVLNKVSLLFATDGLRKLFSHPQPLDLGKHLNSPGSALIVSLAADELSGAGKMVGNIILNAIRREIFSRVTIPENQRVPVQLFIDEFEHFDSTVFEEFLAEARKFRLSLILAHQTVAQVSPKFRSLVLGGVGVKMFFRTGREDSLLLSKDLTGDPKAIDFNNLPVGEAYLWRKENGVEHILVNAPLLKPSLVRTLASYLVKDRMRRSACALFGAGQKEKPATARKAASPVVPKPTAPKNLEEWL